MANGCEPGVDTSISTRIGACGSHDTPASGKPVKKDCGAACGCGGSCGESGGGDDGSSSGIQKLGCPGQETVPAAKDGDQRLVSLWHGGSGNFVRGLELSGHGPWGDGWGQQ